MSRVSRVRVQVRADSFVYEGYVYLLAETRRIQEVLNDPRPFLNLTEVVILDLATSSTHKAPYVALNKGAITHVVVLPDRGESGEALEPDSEISIGGPESSSASDEASLANSSSGVATPMIPSAGPRTMPAPPPIKRRGDPTTQPFPALDEDVSDLILDDDSEHLSLSELQVDPMDQSAGASSE
ncbi:MAG: hypothetical protein VX498_01410 [Myxococcota bacterium]|nr:hypothetical protein [Myxococcota bacterium]